MKTIEDLYELTATDVNDLRLEHNRAVKPRYRVQRHNQDCFGNFLGEYNTDYSCEAGLLLMYIEIGSHQTITGNPYTLEIAYTPELVPDE